MYKLMTGNEQSLVVLINRLYYAITHEVPVTLTYLEYPGTEAEAITVRTVEPYDLRLSKAGHPYMRSIDRQKERFRSWRLERVIMYTIHKGAHNALDYDQVRLNHQAEAVR